MKRIQELDASPDAGTPEQIAALENYVQNGTREEKLAIREHSGAFLRFQIMRLWI